MDCAKTVTKNIYFVGIKRITGGIRKTDAWDEESFNLREDMSTFTKQIFY